jgi:hypothetical protein
MQPDGTMTFAGDDFDRLYLKYFSRKHDIQIEIDDNSPEGFLSDGLQDVIENTLDFLDFVFWEDSGTLRSDIMDTLSLFLLKDDLEVGFHKNPFDSNLSVAQLLYDLSYRFIGEASYKLATLTLTTPWFNLKKFYTFKKAQDQEFNINVIDFEKFINELSTRAEILGGKVEIEIVELPVLSPDVLLAKAKSSKNEDIMTILHNIHYSQMYNAYVTLKNNELTLLHSRYLLPSTELKTGFEANNIGYMLMSLDELEQARTYLELSIAFEEDRGSIALPEYNLGVLFAKDNNFKLSLSHLNFAKEEALKKPKDELGCFCLILPTNVSSSLQFQEIYNCNLLDTILLAIDAITKYCSDNNLLDEKASI